MNPDYTKDYQKQLALGFRGDYKQVIQEIDTFEKIFKDKTKAMDIRNKVRAILEDLYKQRDNYGFKSEHYRALHNGTKNNRGSITWGKSRA